MNAKLYVAKVATTLAVASLAITLATTAAFGRARIPGTTLPTGEIYTGGGGGGGGPDLGPDDPFSKPRIPGQPNLVERTDTSITMHWTDNSSYEQGYNLYRGPSYSGPWTQIAVFGATPGNTATMQYTDAGLPRDTGYYYRVGAYNFYGESFSVPQSMATIDGRDIWRVQLRLRTANVPDANTDDDVYVYLKEPHATYLNYSHNDFERGNEFTYDLLTDGLSDLSDINEIYIIKPGSDGWCIEALALLINGREIYNEQFGSTASTCHWLDQGGDSLYHYFITRTTLRAHPLWQGFEQPPPPLGLPRAELESRIEGIVGDALHGTDAYWGDLDGDRYVEVTGKDGERAHVTVDLSADVPGFDAEVDLSFDLKFTGACSDGQTPLELHITTENVSAGADLDWYTELLTLGLANLAEGGIADRVVDAFPDLDKTITINTNETVCVTPVVIQSGDVVFTVTRTQKPSGKPPVKGGVFTTFPKTATEVVLQ